jgi:phosphoglycerol transferase
MSNKPIVRKNTPVWITCFLQLAITAIALLAIFRPWLKDWTVPFNYQGDTIFQLVLIKSIANNGWTWLLPELSAPMSGFHAIAFPQNISFSWALMKIISIFTSEPGLILNLYWFISIGLTSVTCHIALRILKIPPVVTLLTSTLYALLPYALMRNTTHISLTYIFTPIIAAYSIVIINNCSHQKFDPNNSIAFSVPLLWVSCIAIGLDYIYTAYFSCCFLLIAGILGSLANKNYKSIKMVVIPVLLIACFTLLNLAPTIWAWYYDGKPPNMGYKSYADVEVYGLKIRHLLSSPALMELFPKLGNIQYPLENENRTAMLGLVGGVGFIAAILYGLLAHKKQMALLWGAGTLTIAGTLFGTIGGFGAILSLVIGPDIRAYNRVSPFIAFFSFFILSYLLSRAIEIIKDSLARRGVSRLAANSIAAFGLIAIFIVALIDQSYAVRPLLNRYTNDFSQTSEERHFVEDIETNHPGLTHFYQLPETVFPVDAGTHKMGPYDHGRPYIWSKHLNWSWPNFSIQAQGWLEKLGEPTTPQFLKNLAYSGFNAIWLDRNGYEAPALQLIQRNLHDQLGKPVLISEHGRYEIYTLEPLIKKGLDTNIKTNFLYNPVGIDYAKGFYPAELVGKSLNRWAQNRAELMFYNFSKTQQNIQFQALLSYNMGGKLTILMNGITKEMTLQDGKINFALPITLAPNSKMSVKLKYDGPAVYAPNDPRAMYLSFHNPVISIEQ